ncbi:uncharacterized protein [Nicotiana tomentosiformis]|uniref:uncharacterized protein n=1 Tax=Nicotiana tomentosiformis TaxID=4098 RepID=UPI00388CE2DA
MRLALLGKNKLGFVEGTCVKSLYRGELADLWEQCNAVVLSWIGRCVSQQQLPSIVYASNAAKVWAEFKERFGKSNLTRFYHLWTQIGTLIKQRLVQFLVGLNETYAHVRCQILFKPPVLLVNEAYALVIQEESQRALGVMDMNKEPLTMLAGRGQMMKGKRIVGYPPNFKSKRKPMQDKGAGGFKTYANNTTVEGNNSVEGHSSTESQSQGHYFTEEEYKQLIDLLNKSSVGDCKVNMAGASHHITSCKEKLVDINKLGGQESRKLQGLYSGKVMGIGRETDGLYILRKAIKPVAATTVIKGNYNTKLWHSRLGHPSVKAMQHIPILKGLADEHAQQEYQIYSMAKQHRTTFPDSTSKADLLRLDNGTEFFNSKCSALFSDLGIIHQSSCPYTPQQNGTVERKHRHILEVARALRIQSSVPIRFWGECIRNAVYLINKLPTAVLKSKSPYEYFMEKHQNWNT